MKEKSKKIINLEEIRKERERPLIILLLSNGEFEKLDKIIVRRRWRKEQHAN